MYPFRWGPSEGPSQKEGAAVHDATKRFEIETLLKAGLAKARVAEITGVSLRTVHRVRAEVEAFSAETEGTDTEAGTEAPPRPAEARPPDGGPGRPNKITDRRWRITRDSTPLERILATSPWLPPSGRCRSLPRSDRGRRSP